METDELIKQIHAIASTEEMIVVSEAIRAEPGKMDPEVQNALLKRLADLTEESRNLLSETKNTLLSHGISYPLTDWITPKNYAVKFGIKNVETVLNWIKRGIISADCVKDVPELGVRLVRAIEYNPRAYGQSSDK